MKALLPRTALSLGAVSLLPLAFVLGAAMGIPKHGVVGAPDLSALWSWSWATWLGSGFDAQGNAASVVYEPVAAARNLTLSIFAIVAVFATAARFLGPFAGASGDKDEQLTSARRKFDAELTGIVKLVQSYLDDNKNYSEALSRGNRDIEVSASPEKIRTAIQLLISENQNKLQTTKAYEQRLQETRSQITDLRTALVQTQEISVRDALTKAFSRRHFDAAIVDAAREANVHRAPLSLILADIDHFKSINDTFGHQIGDEALKNFTQIMLDGVRVGDTVARYGGEEFAIILPETSVEEATKLADRLRQQTESMTWVVKGGPQTVKFTSSFGVAQLRPGEASASLIQRADATLYAAKTAGRNRVTTAR